jgi:hypothetical protein
MKVSRQDVVPLLAIAAAGSMGVLATARGLRSLSPPGEQAAESRFAAPRDAVAASDAELRIHFDQTQFLLGFPTYHDLFEEVEALRDRHRQVQRRVSNLPLVRSADAHSEEITELRATKGVMIEAVQNLERELDRAARHAQVQGFGLAAELIRESDLKEKIRYSRGTIEQWDPGSAMALERDIEADLQAVRDRIDTVWRTPRYGLSFRMGDMSRESTIR